MTVWRMITVVFLFLFGLVRVVFADQLVKSAEVSADQVGWSLEAGVTAWMPPIEGYQIKNGLRADVEASQQDRIDDFRLGGELFLEMTNGKWTFIFQPQYVDAVMDGTLGTPFGNVPLDVEAKAVVLEYWVGRRFGQPQAWVEVLVGGHHVDIDIDVESAFGKDQSELDWDDPFVGVRGYKAFGERWSVNAMVGAGGFNLSKQTSESAWEGRLGASFKLTPRWSIHGGYRYSDAKYNENENSPVPSTLKYKLKGPFLATSVKVK